AVDEVARRYGLDMPRRLLDLEPERIDGGDAIFRVRTGATPNEVQRSVIASIVPYPSPECLDRLQSMADGEAMWRLLLERDAAVGWWEVQLSMEPATVGDPHLDDPASEVRRMLLALPIQDGADAVDGIGRQVRSCSTE